MSKIKVLLLLHDLSPTGAPKLAVSAFERFGDQVELRTISYHGGLLRDRVRQLGPVQTLVSYQWPGGMPTPRALLLFLAHRSLSVGKARVWSQGVRRWKPDVVYVNSVAGLLAAKRLRLPPVPVLLHVHELDSFLYPFSRDAPALLRGLPDRYVAVSQAVADALTGRYGVDAGKVSVVPAFVEEFPVPAPVPSPAGDTRLVVGGAGVVSWVKGVPLWLLMAAEVKKRLGADRVRFVWVGMVEDEEGWRFREMARKLHLTDDIEWVPFTAHPLDYYAAFDIFALTSWEDSCPLVVLENMLLQKPVVCFAGSGGAREEVGDAGFVVSEFSPTAMAEVVVALAADPARRAALGEAARQRVRENFTASKQAPHLWREIEALARGLPSA
jgi:glycosyltransferase involved in cell wall biosynthesis